jgi:hypothetical protein
MTPRAARNPVPLILGVVTLIGAVVLLIADAMPQRFPAGSHAILGAFPLAAIACAYLIFQLTRRDVTIGAGEIVKAILLAAAFLFWAANQMWPGLPEAGLFNDIAIGLFVLDIFLAIAGWPSDHHPERNDEIALMRDLRHVDAGRHFTRDELDER